MHHYSRTQAQNVCFVESDHEQNRRKDFRSVPGPFKNLHGSVWGERRHQIHHLCDDGRKEEERRDLSCAVLDGWTTWKIKK